MTVGLEFLAAEKLVKNTADWNLLTYTGMLGLAPPTNAQEYNSSLICQLMRNNKIDRPMFSVYLQDHNLTSAFKNPVQYLQIGSFDRRALRFENETTVFKSISSDKWELFIHNFSFGNQSRQNTASTVTFDPAVEYLFAPKDNFLDVAKMMHGMVPDLQCDAYRCFFDKPCNKLEFKNRYSLYFDLEDAEQHKLRPKLESIKLFNITSI